MATGLAALLTLPDQSCLITSVPQIVQEPSMSSRSFFPSAASIVLALIPCAATVADEDAPKVIKPEDAFANATKTVTVEFIVRNSSQIKDRNGNDMVFLNSMKNFRDDDNFTVVIFAEALAKFRKAEIKAPAEHYRDKKVRVTGGIELRRGKPQIILKSPERIRIVKDEAKPEKSAA